MKEGRAIINLLNKGHNSANFMFDACDLARVGQFELQIGH